MKSLSRLIIISIFVYSSLLSISCSSCFKREIAPPPPPEPSDIIESRSPKITVRIFSDATVSMEGFVIPGSSANYVQILPYLESAVITGWSDGKVEFYKFGTEVLAISKPEYLKASQPAFYQNHQINKETHIQKVIDYANINGLTVIVTDLFQSDTDVNLLTTKLKEKFIQKNLAIGILGLKSQYDGTVFDVGIDSYAFPYRSGKNPESFRPLYVLMLGKHADVVHYFERLKSSGLPFISETTFIIFSRHLVNPLSSFENASMDSIDSLVEVSNLMASGLQDNRIKQFRIQGNPEIASFVSTLKYTPLPYTMPFDPQRLEYEVVAKQHQGDRLMESIEAKRYFTIEQIALSGSDITFHAKLIPTSLPGNGIYYYEAIMRPIAVAYQMPNWISKWDMGTSHDGSKTLNLYRLLTDLWRATVQIHQPKIARFYCYIKKG